MGALLALVGCGTETPQELLTGRTAQALQGAYGPDFVITQVSAPASVALGQPLTVQVTVCNQGTYGTSHTDVEVYLSADALQANTPDTASADRLVGSATVYLAEGRCVTESITGQALPPTAPGGSPSEGAYYVGAVADPRNERTESNEDNNTQVGPRLGVGSRSDFIVTAVKGPASVRAGQNLTAQVTVCNQGTTSDSTDFELYLSADATIRANAPGVSEDRLIKAGTTPALAPGQCVTQSVTGVAAAPTAGGPPADSAYYLGAVVDPRNTRVELNEDNNTLVGERMGLGTQADLVVTSVTGPASVNLSKGFRTQVRVCNQGTASADSVVEVYLSTDRLIQPGTPGTPSEDRLVGGAATPTLVAGQCVMLTLSSPGVSHTPTPPGPNSALYLGAVVDPQKTLAELREDNNLLVGDLVGVGDLPDFVVKSVKGQFPANSGPLQFEVTVCNQGQKSGGARGRIALSAAASLQATTYSMDDIVMGEWWSSYLGPADCERLRVPAQYNGWGIPDGVYHVLAMADVDNYETELSEDNNVTVGNALGLGYGPDFVVTAVKGPASVRAGQAFTAQVTVCNQGVASGPADVALYLSADTSLRASAPGVPSEDVLLGGGSLSDLHPGRCVTHAVSATATAPTLGAPVSDSAYHLAAVVTAPSGINEVNKGNNILVGDRMGVGTRSDFVVASVTGPASVLGARVFTAQVQVCNQGTASASSVVEVYLSADNLIQAGTSSIPSEDSFVGRATTPTLAVGQCISLPISGPAPSAVQPEPGQDSAWYLGAVVDPGNTLAELREDNNTLAGERMGVGAMADIVVASVTGPVSLREGDQISVQVRVCNQGTQSDYTDVGIFLSTDTFVSSTYSYSNADKYLGSVSLWLDAGQCVTTSVTGSTSNGGGWSSEIKRYHLMAQVNPYGQTRSELRNDNNTTVGQQVVVGYGTDLVVTSVTGPASVRAGQSLTAQVTVCNQGTYASETVNVEVYLSADASIQPFNGVPTDDSLLAPATQIPRLEPDHCVTLPVTGVANPPTSPVPGADSAYYLGAAVIMQYSSYELREDNNAMAGDRVGIGLKADLVATAVTGPSSVQPGQSFTAQVTVCNQGTQTATSYVDVYLSADRLIHSNVSSQPFEDILLARTTTPSLGVGMCTTIPVSGQAPAESATRVYFLGVVMDSRHGVAELREDNNTLVGDRIGVGLLPDFVITSLKGPRFLGSGYYGSSSYAYTVTVCNRGQGPGSPFVSLYAPVESSGSGPGYRDNLGSVSGFQLAPGVCGTRTGTFSTSQARSTLQAVVDEENLFPELIEDNNSRMNPPTTSD